VVKVVPLVREWIKGRTSFFFQNLKEKNVKINTYMFFYYFFGKEK